MKNELEFMTESIKEVSKELLSETIVKELINDGSNLEEIHVFFEEAFDQYILKKGSNHQFQIEEKEFSSKLDALFYDFLLKFWKINVQLPKILMIELLKLLPSAHRLVGDLNAISKSLEHVLRVDINYNKSWCQLETSESSRLNDINLGQNLILGNQTGSYPEITFEIGTIPPEDIVHYLEGGDYKKFLDLFFGYFLPIDLEYKIILKSSQKLSIEKKHLGILGYTLEI